MRAGAYMQQVEEALGDLDRLRELRGAAAQDRELDEVQRVQVLGRIDGYLADEARAAATDDGGEPEMLGLEGEGA